MSLEEIFNIIADRIIEKKESLRQIGKHEVIGIEGWLKVEAVAALGDQVKRVKNRGVDLELENNVKVELKAATDFGYEFIKKGATKYSDVPCLFLADGSNSEKKIKRFNSDKDVELLTHKIFKDNGNKWMIGMIRKRKTKNV